MKLEEALKMIESVCGQLKLTKAEHQQLDLALETIKQNLVKE